MGKGVQIGGGGHFNILSTHIQDFFKKNWRSNLFRKIISIKHLLLLLHNTFIICNIITLILLYLSCLLVHTGGIMSRWEVFRYDNPVGFSWNGMNNVPGLIHNHNYRVCLLDGCAEARSISLVCSRSLWAEEQSRRGESTVSLRERERERGRSRPLCLAWAA